MRPKIKQPIDRRFWIATVLFLAGVYFAAHWFPPYPIVNVSVMAIVYLAYGFTGGSFLCFLPALLAPFITVVEPNVQTYDLDVVETYRSNISYPAVVHWMFWQALLLPLLGVGLLVRRRLWVGWRAR